MAYRTLLTNSYIPTRPKKYNQQQDRFDLDGRLNQMKFDEVIENSDSYFENLKLTNYDLIHNECRGDELSFSEKHYQTLYKEKLNSEIIETKKLIYFFGN